MLKKQSSIVTTKKKRIPMLKYLIFSFALISSLQLNAQQIYKWVDKQGNVTYSRKKPPQGIKEQKIETIRSLGTTTETQKQTFKSNASIPNTYVNPYQNNTTSSYSQTRQQVRSAENEALRQKIINEASTPYKNSKGLTANQRNTLAAMNGVNVSSGDSYSNSNSSYSAPMPQAPTPTHMTNCDGSGCWDNQGNRYNGNSGTYYNNGRMCRDIGGQLQCN